MPEVKIKRDFSIPAAIQFKNPGAMWPGDRATKWGSKSWQYLSDGTGQGGGGKGNKIAHFDSWVDGICAQMDLWMTGPNYHNQTLKHAITIWSGGNHVQSYLDYLKSHVHGLTDETIMNDAFWRGPMAMPFLKAQAQHEAGKPIPATQEDYLEAQRRVLGGHVPEAGKPILRNGSFGVAVRELQTVLGIRVDGIFGRVTENAVRVKQKTLGLVVDGVVGPQTWSKLNG